MNFDPAFYVGAVTRTAGRAWLPAGATPDGALTAGGGVLSAGGGGLAAGKLLAGGVEVSCAYAERPEPIRAPSIPMSDLAAKRVPRRS